MESGGGVCHKNDGNPHIWKFGKCRHCGVGEGEKGEGGIKVVKFGECDRGGKHVYKFAKCTKCGVSEGVSLSVLCVASLDRN